MFRTQYDSDISIYSPEGRLFQIEYAMKAVSQGSCALGLKSDNHVVLLGLKRSPSELGSFQEKVFRIGPNSGVAIAGLTADARVLLKFMRNETLSYNFKFGKPPSPGLIVKSVALKSQSNTQIYGRRPFGVGLLVAGFNEGKTFLYETSPSGNFFSHYAQAIGARAQSVKTYLEHYYEEFPNLSLNELIRHGIFALKEAASKTTLTVKNVSVSVVGLNEEFRLLKEEEIEPFISELPVEEEVDMED